MVDKNTTQLSPLFSFLIPTRGRPKSLLKLLESFKEKTDNIKSMEIILVIDEDDHIMSNFRYDDISIKRVIVKSDMNMGALNMAGYNASSGQYIMLLNDDVVVQTNGWDKKILSCFNSFSDSIVLVHVNDLIFKEKLCTFPFVSRTFCDIAGGICPTEYRRHRIDDHIYNIFNLIGVVGKKRIVYLPDVIFEHHHYVINKKGKRVYKQSDTIEEFDKVLFNDLLPQRKQIALELIEHIDHFAQHEKTKNRKKQLKKITNSLSVITPENVHIRPDDFIPTSLNSRITIGVVSADTNSNIARKCLENIKKYTTNYDLILLENNFGPGFSHPREMNKILDITKTDYLVLMDDDVFVEPNWVDGLFKHMKPDVGVVTPLHKDRQGALSYAGIIFNPDESGEHGHIVSHINAPTPTMTLCSALLMIDMNKCGHLRFSESYHKYFLDIDYGLRIWESGFQVVCSPDIIITHIGGGTLPHGSRLISKLFEEQRQIFEGEWLKTNRFKKLKKDIFEKIPTLRFQMDLSSKANELLTSDPSENISDFTTRATHLINKIKPYQTLKNYILNYICRRVSWNTSTLSDSKNEHLIVLLGLLGHPVLIEQNYKGFNIVLYCQTYYAIPEAEKVFEIKHIQRLKNSFVYTAQKLDVIKEIIDEDVDKGFTLNKPGFSKRIKDFFYVQYIRIQLLLRAFYWISKKLIVSIVQEITSPMFLRSIGGFFRLQCRRLQAILKNPGITVQETQKVISSKKPNSDFSQRAKTFFRYRYNHFRMALHAQTQKWIIQSNLPKLKVSSAVLDNNTLIQRKPDNKPFPVLVDKDYKGHVIFKNAKEFHAFKVDEWNSHSMPIKPEYSAKSDGGIRRLIHEGTPRKVANEYKNFSIFGFEHFFFAIESAKGVFSLKNFQIGEYEKCAIAYSVPEVKYAVDNILKEQEGLYPNKCLLFCCTPLNSIENLLHRFKTENMTVLVKNVDDCPWADGKTIVLETVRTNHESDFHLDTISPELLGHLRAETFDRVIIPSDLSEICRDNSKIKLASEISNNVEIADPQGKSVTYSGETLNRFLYNTAYLASIFEMLTTIEGKDVLEVGCSDGLVCDIISKLGAKKIDGVDIIKSVGCRSQGKSIAYHLMDSINLNFPDKSFDLVLSIATLEHVPDPFRVLTELKRVTKVGGCCYVQAGPLYYSPLGHHMFDFFSDYPWIHLRLSEDEIIEYCKTKKIDEKIFERFAIPCEDYIHGMLNSDHINGLFIDDYRLDKFMVAGDIRIEKFKINCEGREYLSKKILSELSNIDPNRLIEHGFELSFRRIN